MSCREGWIRGHRAHGGVLLVPCLLQDSHRYWFLADTGAAITMLSQQVADELGLDLSHPLRRERIASVHQVAWAPVVRLESLQVGSRRVTDIEVLVLSFPSDLRVDGLLGVNFLERFRSTFDFNRSILILE